MGQLNRTTREPTVERILLDGGFNPRTILAANDIIRARMGIRQNPAQPSRSIPTAYGRASAAR